jgi:hypothetical protein
MASEKKRRKAARLTRNQQPAAGPYRHPDGDRRQRKTMAAAIKAAKARHAFEHLESVILPEEPPEGA